MRVVLNPEHHILPLTEGADFDVDLELEIGSRYVAGTYATLEAKEKRLGTIAVDALFSPVQKVKYNVTNARVGQNTDFDKLALEIWTDGSVDPEVHWHLQQKISEQMQVFINFQEQDEPIVEEVVEEEEQWNEHLFSTC